MARQPQTVISVDVETNGEMPPHHSMISLGAVAYRLSDGAPLAGYSRNLRPLEGSGTSAETMEWWQGWPEAWAMSTRDPWDPPAAMHEFAEWMAQFPQRKILAGPVAFDGCWVRYYLERFCHGRRRYLGWHNMMDLRSVAWAWTGRYAGPVEELVTELTGACPVNPHPHVAIYDARQQGDMFVALLRWARANGRSPQC